MGLLSIINKAILEKARRSQKQHMRNFGPCQLRCENHDNPELRMLRNSSAARADIVDRALFEEARRALRSAMDSAPPSLPLRPPAPA